VSFQETYLLTTYRALNSPTGAGSTLGVLPCKLQGADDTFPYAYYVLPLSMKILGFGMVLAMDNVLSWEFRIHAFFNVLQIDLQLELHIGKCGE
jgi:hypothetical protein